MKKKQIEKPVSQVVHIAPLVPYSKRRHNHNGIDKKTSLYSTEKVWAIGQKIPALPKDLLEPQLSETAHYIGQTRYAKRNEKGEPVETDKEMFWRVAYSIACADLLYEGDAAKMILQARRFYDIMATQQYIPNTPTMLNAGKANPQMSACFVLPIDDDMRSIGKTMVDMALIHKSGGGTGFSFSRLRPYSDMIASSRGFSTGPCAFLEAYNAVTSQIKQGGVRRGANMGIMHITHPDILRFAVMKVDEFNLTNFNISVTVTEDWMRQVSKDKKFVEEGLPAGRQEPLWDEIIEEIKLAQQIRDVDLKLKKTEDGVVKLYELVKATQEDEGFNLINPRNKEVTNRLNAYKVFLLITKLAWQYGDPGMILIDRINNSGANPTPHLGQIESTNPCGEQPLLPYDACTLGSINVGKFVKNGQIDFDELGEVTEEAIHFLDNVLDMNNYPIPEIKEMTQKIRRVGLGVMGFADLLYTLGIGYNTDEGLNVAEEVMASLHKHDKLGSIKLAEIRGVFPVWYGSIFDPKSPYFKGEELHIRNSAVTTIAPTGTIAMLADASSGIEPYFALSYAKNTIEGKRLFNANPLFLEIARKEGFYKEDLLEKIEANNGSVQGLDEIPEIWQKVFVTTRDISPDWHVKMQAAFQKHVDNAISKTINFPFEATVDDVRAAYIMVYETGCKGITIYRDGSRTKQILEVKKEGSYYDQLAGKVVEPKVALNGRPMILRGRTYKIVTPVGEAFVTVNRDETDQPFEVFLTIGKAGMHIAADAEAIGRLTSLALRVSRPNSKEVARKIVNQLRGIGGASQVGFGKDRVMSLADAVAKVLAEDLSLNEVVEEKVEPIPLNLEENKEQKNTHVDLCPSCGQPSFIFEEGCKKCESCGYSVC